MREGTATRVVLLHWSHVFHALTLLCLVWRLPRQIFLCYVAVWRLLRQVFRCYVAVHVIIATPGRVLDLMNKNLIKCQSCSMLVLDEVSTAEPVCSHLNRNNRMWGQAWNIKHHHLCCQAPLRMTHVVCPFPGRRKHNVCHNQKGQKSHWEKCTARPSFILSAQSLIVVVLVEDKPRVPVPTHVP